MTEGSGLKPTAFFVIKVASYPHAYDTKRLSMLLEELCHEYKITPQIPVYKPVKAVQGKMF